MDEFSHIQIDGGEVTGATIIVTDKGKHAIPTLVGSYRFFVNVVEKDGGIIGMWDGADYAKAIAEAKSLMRTFDLDRIEDLTGRAA